MEMSFCSQIMMPPPSTSLSELYFSKQQLCEGQEAHGRRGIFENHPLPRHGAWLCVSGLQSQNSSL